MNKIASLLGIMLIGCTSVFAQGAKNIKINEVLTNNTASIQDEFGAHGAWIELVNTAFSSYNIRGMYITTDKSVLDPKMSVPERMKRMSIIPNGDSRTALSARKHIIFYMGNNPAEGSLHLSAKMDSTTQWVALYDGNAIDLIDSVSIPALKANCSYARHRDGDDPLRQPEDRRHETQPQRGYPESELPGAGGALFHGHRPGPCACPEGQGCRRGHGWDHLDVYSGVAAESAVSVPSGAE